MTEYTIKLLFYLNEGLSIINVRGSYIERIRNEFSKKGREIAKSMIQMDDSKNNGYIICTLIGTKYEIMKMMSMICENIKHNYINKQMTICILPSNNQKIIIQHIAQNHKSIEMEILQNEYYIKTKNSLVDFNRCGDECIPTREIKENFYMNKLHEEKCITNLNLNKSYYYNFYEPIVQFIGDLCKELPKQPKIITKSAMLEDVSYANKASWNPIWNDYLQELGSNLQEEYKSVPEYKSPFSTSLLYCAPPSSDVPNPNEFFDKAPGTPKNSDKSSDIIVQLATVIKDRDLLIQVLQQLPKI